MERDIRTCEICGEIRDEDCGHPDCPIAHPWENWDAQRSISDAAAAQIAGDETKEQVFEALLEDWRQDESNLIAEFSGDQDTENAAADREMEQWRERFRNAS